MEKIARRLAWLDDLVLKINLALCGTLLTVMVVVAALGVFFRFVLHASLSWSEEFDSYLFVWLTCLGAAAGVKLRAHPEVRAIPDRLPKPAQTIVADLTDAAVLAFGLAATLALASTGTPLLVIPQQLFANLNNFGLLAIPFFMLTGAIMDSGGVSKRIIDFSQALVGFIRGGIGHVTIIASMFFADLS